ncbi:MAG: hypothetical protein Q9214_003088, partial [Letrouitia sp. 1 TL-2023]
MNICVTEQDMMVLHSSKDKGYPSTEENADLVARTHHLRTDTDEAVRSTLPLEAAASREARSEGGNADLSALLFNRKAAASACAFISNSARVISSDKLNASFVIAPRQSA